MPYAIGCDVGSQSLKAVVLTPSGDIVATALQSVLGNLS